MWGMDMVTPFAVQPLQILHKIFWFVWYDMKYHLLKTNKNIPVDIFVV